MSEKPIIFSAPMVKALLDGSKTQTRRVIKPQPEARTWETGRVDPAVILHDGHWYSCDTSDGSSHDTPYHLMKCPYNPGDLLWVRETWAIANCGNRVPLSRDAWPEWPINRLEYIATDKAPAANGYWWNKRPSIHMPRWASRITLEVLSVRPERLQDISDEDAIAEGFHPTFNREDGTCDMSARSKFLKFWDLINGKKPGCSWDDNPWVWRIEFCPVHGSLLIDGECPVCAKKAAHRREQSEKKPEGKG